MRKNKGNAKGFPGAQEKGPELLYEPCDFIVAAAVEKFVTAEVASKLNCKVIPIFFHNSNASHYNPNLLVHSPGFASFVRHILFDSLNSWTKGSKRRKSQRLA